MVEDEIGQYKMFHERYIPLAERHIAWNDVFYQKASRAIARFEEKPIFNMGDNPNVISDYRGLLTDQEFLNTLRLRTIYFGFSKQETEVLIKKANNIIELINEELDND